MQEKKALSSRGRASYDGDLSLPLGLALGSPIFPSGCEGKLGVALAREGRDLGAAFQAPPGSQASSRGEAKDSALLSSRDAGLLEPPERPQRGFHTQLDEGPETP